MSKDCDPPYGFRSIEQFYFYGHDGGEHIQDTERKQYIMPSCYGRGKRLCDLEVPPIPHSCVSQIKKKPESLTDMTQVTGAKGRGRPDTLKEGKIQPGGLSRFHSVESETKAAGGDTATNDGALLDWTIMPPNVVDIGNLPTDMDLELLQDTVASYGTILKYENKLFNGSMFVRFKMADSSCCTMLVNNFHGTDFLGSGNIISCFHLDS